MEVIKLRQELVKDGQQDDFFDEISLDSSFSRIRLSQFYGIELDDFAHEVAILSLWLAEHQMNVEFKAEFGECEPTLPLQSGGHIVCGNATRISWFDVCPNKKEEEVYVLGNPPYLGQKMQSKTQKEDLQLVFSGMKSFKTLDYIACWFLKASRYINAESAFSFVTTNSLCQGMQVPLLWPHIFNLGLEIFVGYKDFHWTNNAKNKASVTCTIVGVRHRSNKPKFLFDSNTIKKVKNINAYLVDGGSIIVEKSKAPISKLPTMVYGNMALDGGNLLLSNEEKINFIEQNPNFERFVLKTTGSNPNLGKGG